ncbi:MAG: zinc transporter ZupT [Bacillota bacterium]|nr:zinc transporter ZupT [Bacillota bacterium]
MILTDGTLNALLMAAIAGMATLLGAAFILFVKDKNERLISIALGLAAGVMICVSFHDLWPHSEAYFHAAAGEKNGMLLAVSFLVGGVLLATLLDRLVPHADEQNSLGGAHHDLFRVGFVSMLAIMLHNFPEGMATFMANYEASGIGLTVTTAIALHNIPEGLTVALPIYCATGNRRKAFGYTFIAGLAEPVGALLACLLIRVFINDFVMGVIFAMTAGIMLYIALEELLPSSYQYGHKKEALIAVFVGITMMPLVHLIG